MSQPKFRKRSTCFSAQDYVPRYSTLTGQPIIFSGSAAAYVRQNLRRTSEQDRQSARTFLGQDAGRLELEVLAKYMPLISAPRP